MKKAEKYYVVKEQALPEVLQKVLEAKRLLDSEKVITIQEATEQVGISRSSFYKYKDDIFPFYQKDMGKTYTFAVQLDDTPGLLSYVLTMIAKYRANILTIHQSIPVNGIANMTVSIDIMPMDEDIERLMDDIRSYEGVHYIKVLARE